MTRRQALQVLVLAAVLAVAVVSVARAGTHLPGRLMVASLAIVVAVAGVEVVTRAVFKRQFDRTPSLDTALDVVGVIVALVACLLFAKHCHPGMP